MEQRKGINMCENQDYTETFTGLVLNGVRVQENGIIRSSYGYIIGRLADDVSFETLSELNTHTPDEEL